MVEKIHRHDFFFILAVAKGRGDHQIDFTDYAVEDNCVFILRPGQVHQLHLKKGTKGYLIGFDSRFYAPKNKKKKQVFSVASFTNLHKLNSKVYEGLNLILDCIFYEYLNKFTMYEEHIKANLDLFFIELFRENENQKISTSNNNYNQEVLENLLKLLEEHIHTSKQVTFYAKRLHLTTFQLNAIIKNSLGKTCSQLINEQIILEAKRNLLATSTQVKEIAYSLGYDDPSYFIRFFKKSTGYPPESFRQHFK
ncbi:hypothetical protein P278_00080 [Zhouia amylolytica AD3]|uniref:HTH araC/xylS-type domain-containing protein n=2 Tax=Zhouia amylolytica TaxID=376730 RepID=W2UTB7_9FLAO|nr:hypothetical protein P278_00080 [Zhouia amylolytica AD3]